MHNPLQVVQVQSTDVVELVYVVAASTQVVENVAVPAHVVVAPMLVAQDVAALVHVVVVPMPVVQDVAALVHVVVPMPVVQVASIAPG